MRVRPSDLVGFTDSIKRFYFDRGVWLFGTKVEAALQQAEQQARKNKKKTSQAAVNMARQQVLDKMLKIPAERRAKRFKDPAIQFQGPASGKSGGQKIAMSDNRNEIELGAGFLG